MSEVTDTGVTAGRVENGAPARSPWLSFALRRLGGLLLTFVVTVVGTFLLIPLVPGDPAVAAAGQDASLARIEAVRRQLGLDNSLATQFVDYIRSLFAGSLGYSFSFNAPVGDVIASRLPYTLALASASLLLSLAVAIPLGLSVSVFTQDGRRRALDATFSAVTGFISSIPVYVMATLLVLWLAIAVEWFPPAFETGKPVWSMVLPVLAMGLPTICAVARIVRRETDVVLRQEYMRTARGWRIGPLKAYLKYALPNLVTSTLTLSGMLMIGMLGGAVSIETVFDIPGLASAVVTAVENKDFELIQGIVLVLSMLSALFTLAVDVTLAIIDPRLLTGLTHD